MWRSGSENVEIGEGGSESWDQGSGMGNGKQEAGFGHGGLGIGNPRLRIGHGESKIWDLAFDVQASKLNGSFPSGVDSGRRKGGGPRHSPLGTHNLHMGFPIGSKVQKKVF